jgi:hypothetical protein
MLDAEQAWRKKEMEVVRFGPAGGGREEEESRGFWPMSRGNGFPFSDLDILGGNFHR